MTEAERQLLLAVAEGVAVALGKAVFAGSGPENLIVLAMSNDIRDLARTLKEAAHD